MGKKEDNFVDFFYKKYQGRVAIGVGYAAHLTEVFPFVMEDKEGEPLGIIAMAALSNQKMESVHIFHFSAFKPKNGDGSIMLDKLCRRADQFQVMLSLSPIPSPNGKKNLISDKKLFLWYQKFGFKGETVLKRKPR